MATYTPNYGLHQWVPEDTFLRTDFNEDLEKIDTALKGVADSAAEGIRAAESQANAWATAAENNAKAAAQAAQTTANTAQSTASRVLDALEPFGYNIYNLLLQNYYDRKETRYRKDVLFDGFRDKSSISSLTGAVWDESNPSLLLDGVGQQSVSIGTFDGAYTVPRYGSASISYTATGNGTLTRVTVPMLGMGTLTVQHGTEQLATGTLMGGATSTADAVASVSVPVQAGRTYTFTIANTGTSSMALNADRNGTFCYSLTFTPTKTTSGTMTGTSQKIIGTFQGAKVWVRYIGGSVICYLKGNGSDWVKLTNSTNRTTVNADGVTCLENEFTLRNTITGPVQTKLELSASSGKQLRVYDYGAVFF